MTKFTERSFPMLRHAALVAALFVTPASAGTASGAQSPPAPAATCVVGDRFIVVSRSGDAPGNDILARPLSSRSTTATCAFEETPESFRVARAGEAKYVLALQGNALVLDEGTGPSIRTLVITDLVRRQDVWRGQYVPEPAPKLIGHRLVFHKYLRFARKNDCHNVRRIVLQGLTPLYVIKGELSLAAQIFTATGHPRCIAGQ